MTKKEKRELLAHIAERLAGAYPDAVCALDYGGDPWRLLVMGRLSAQCTDARVNVVCKELFAKYPDARSMAEGDIAEIERIVKPCGLYRMKAKNLYDAARMILSDFDGRIPDTMEDLLRLPGVGRKIANLILGDVFAAPAVVCDTHCIRICGRFGMYPESLRDPVRIEYILRDLMDVSDGAAFCHRIVTFGREICTARSPRCAECPIAPCCAHRKKEEEHAARRSAKSRAGEE